MENKKPEQCPDCGEIQGIGNYEECPYMSESKEPNMKTACDHTKTTGGYCVSMDCENSMPQHTPTPWKVDPKDKRDIRDTRGWHLALTTSPANPTIDGEANAAFIVRAVNCHGELLSALKDAYALIDVEGLHKINGNAAEIHRNAYLAIAKAEGR